MSPHGFFVLFLNRYHTQALDFFFRYWTYLGDGMAVVTIFIVLLFLKRRHAYVMGILGITLLLVSYFLKRVVFGKVPRPAKYFENDEILNFVEGVKTHDWYSFPSGHTMTAFVLAGFLALTIQKNYWSLTLFFMACLVGISRVYLVQHFLVDTLVGAATGLVLASLFHILFRNYFGNDFSATVQKN